MRLGRRFESVYLGMANISFLIHIRNIHNFNAYSHICVVFNCERKRIFQNLKSSTL